MLLNKTLITGILINLTFIAGFCYGELSSNGQAEYDKMISTLKSSEKMELSFIRILNSPYTGAADTSIGKASISGEQYSKIIIDDRVIIARQDTVYDYSAKPNQMMISLSSHSGGFKELFINEYFERYEAVVYVELYSDTVSFNLESKDEDDDYIDVVLIAIKSGGSYLPVTLMFKDNLRRLVTWKFERIDLSPSFPTDLFKVKIPPDCRIVDLTTQ
ncbi:MAG: hypothetical protein GY855_14085 [candidate division Zixibacteria bacterium]|nr:hypothetical protein [candidate division Zixibacteria bacterium]